MEYIGRKAIILILVFFIGYAYGGTPHLAYESSTYSTIPEDSYGFVCRFHVVDPSDTHDHINVSAGDEFTRKHFTATQIGNGNDVWVNVTVKTLLDRETLSSVVKATFRITDDQKNEIQLTHKIYIMDVNDNRPEFENSLYTLEINELPCNKTTVYTKIHATDKDSNADGLVRYSMVPNAQSPELWKMYNDTFSIDPVTGCVNLNKCLDYERNDYYSFIVTAKDSGLNRGLHSIAELIIHVRDVKDESSAIIG